MNYINKHSAENAKHLLRRPPYGMLTDSEYKTLIRNVYPSGTVRDFIENTRTGTRIYVWYHPIPQLTHQSNVLVVPNNGEPFFINNLWELDDGNI
jgi:hypothetical protein